MTAVLETGAPLRADDYLAECARRGVAAGRTAPSACATGWVCR